MKPPVPDNVARTRFFVIQLVRLGGVALALLGLVVWHGNLVSYGGNMLLGLPLTVIGVIDATVVPKLLARMWRTPDR